MKASSRLGLKLKALMFAGIYYLDLRFAYAGVPKLYGAQEHMIIKAALNVANKNWPTYLGAFSRWLVMSFASVLAGISAIDNAYANFFKDFIDEYNKLRGERFGKRKPVHRVPKEVQKPGVSGQTQEKISSRTDQEGFPTGGSC